MEQDISRGRRAGGLRAIQPALDQLMLALSIYAVPLIIGLASIAALFAWHSHYDYGLPSTLRFTVLSPSVRADTPEAAAQALRNQAGAAVTHWDTRLSEQPLWLSFAARPDATGSPVSIEFPSRHATEAACWDADTLAPLGAASHEGAQGAMRQVKAGFALALGNLEAPSRILCKTAAIGPARISVLEWQTADLAVNTDEFHRNAGLLDGGLLVLAVFMLITALINKEKIYLLFGAWLLLNMRVGALSTGWDLQWLDRTVPFDIVPRMRLVTIAAYYLLILMLFLTLFKEDLRRVGTQLPIRICQWMAFSLLPLSCLLSFPQFLPIYWTAAGIGIALLGYYLTRILMVARSPVAIWYSAALGVALFASLYEVISAAIGFKGLIGAINSVTAALASSLLASIAVAEQMRLAHKRSLEAQEELRHTFEAMPIGLFTLDLQGHFLTANPTMIARLGKNLLLPEYNFWGQHFNADAWPRLQSHIYEHPEAELELCNDEIASHSPRYFLVKATLARGKIKGSLQDVTEKVKAIEDLRFMANNDPLTRTFNRRGLERQYEEALAQAALGKPLALAYLDLDRFKLINDLYGHTVGDEVLREVAQRMGAMINGAQHLGRVGGDEFVVILPNTTMEAATWLCKGLINAVSATAYQIGDKAFQVGVSIGLVEVEAGTLMKDALASADSACREAKARHKSGLMVYRTSDAAYQSREAELRLVERLSTNAAPEGLFLEMQPIMSLRRPHDTLDIEVLVRMREKDGSVIPAGRILAAAESSGRTAVIDRWVLSTTLAWITRHRARLPQTRFVCMNLNGASLNDEKFMQSAFSIIEAHPLAACCLCIEITESVALHDLKNTRRFIDTIRGYGVKVALDDFGAGYTSFSYLKELPADFVKIDGSFVVNMNAHPGNIAIVEGIVRLAKNLGMRTVAEWAEDAGTIATLSQLGVDYVQGYAVSRPQSPERILEALSAASFIQNEETANLVMSLSADSASGEAPDARTHDPDNPAFKTMH